MDKEYLKSLCKCPICGEVIGFNSEGDEPSCSMILLSLHVQECRKAVKRDRIRYTE